MEARAGDVVLEANNITAGKLVHDVSFNVKSGEILGFAGLVGSGRTETMRAIFGADILDKGEVLYFGKKAKFRTPSQLRPGTLLDRLLPGHI